MRGKGWSVAALALMVVATAPERARAQALPPGVQNNPALNPDRINEEERRRLQERAEPRATPNAGKLVEPPAASAAPASAEPEVRFRLTAVRFDASAYLSAAELDALAKPLIGREISIAEIRALIARVNALYAARGIITARAALPPQKIVDGVVSVRLVEGRIGAISVTGKSRRDNSHITKLGIDPGDYADPTVLERRLKRFNLLNDTQLRARLAQGSAFGTTDIALDPSPPKRIGVDVFADNNGFASTGVWEEGAVLRAYRLFGAADRASAVFVHSNGVKSGSANYSIPLWRGLRGGLSASTGTTDIVQPGAAGAGPIAIHGTSLSFGGDLSAVLIARRRTALLTTLSVQDTRSTTNVAGPRVLDNRLLQGGGGVVVSRETPGLLLNAEVDVTDAHLIERVSGTVRDPVLLRGNFAIAKAIGGGVQARVRGDWQHAFASDLPGILQYQIGGARSVRAWEPGIAAGDSGGSVTGELGWTTRARAGSIEPFVFVDHAQERGPSRSVSLQGAGAGLNAAIGPLTLRAHYAFALDRGGLDRYAKRGYVSATLHF